MGQTSRSSVHVRNLLNDEAWATLRDPQLLPPCARLNFTTVTSRALGRIDIVWLCVWCYKRDGLVGALPHLPVLNNGKPDAKTQHCCTSMRLSDDARCTT